MTNRLINIFEANDPRLQRFQELCEIFGSQEIPVDVMQDMEKYPEIRYIWMRYILDKDKNVVEVMPSIDYAWIEASGGHDCRIMAKDDVNGIEVSTVFTMIAMLSYNRKEPLVFETMYFMKKKSQKHARYATYEVAMAGHKECLKQLLEQS